MKKPPPRGAIRAASSLVLADRGAEALRLGRFKEAVEIFKQLARQDPRPEWTDRLADAYAGRAHALADKGMFKEAAMVLENTLAADGHFARTGALPELPDPPGSAAEGEADGSQVYRAAACG